MSFLQPEILLQLAEQAELPTVLALMQTNRAASRLIRKYERSITIARLEKLIEGPRGIMLPPRGSILSSATEKREPIEPNCFKIIQELNMRERRKDEIFASGALMERVIRNSDVYQGLPDHETERLLSRLRRACTIADRLSDCVAYEMLTAARAQHEDADMLGQRQASDNTQEPRAEEDAEEKRAKAKASGGKPHESSTAATEAADRGRPRFEIRTEDLDLDLIMRKARKAQIALIKTLPALDLAYLSLLATFAGMAYATQYASEMDSDPSAWDRVVAFRETVLRHGSFVLWAELFAPTPAEPSHATLSRQSVRQYLNDVNDEIFRWELGDGAVPTQDSGDELENGAEKDQGGERDDADDESASSLQPGLNMTITSAFLKLVDRPIERSGLEMNFLVTADLRK